MSAAVVVSTDPVVMKIAQDPEVVKYIDTGLAKIKESPALNTLSDIVSVRLTDKGIKLSKEQVKHGILLALKNAIK